MKSISTWRLFKTCSLPNNHLNLTISKGIASLMLLLFISLKLSAQNIPIDGNPGDWLNFNVGAGKALVADVGNATVSSTDNQFTQGSKDGSPISGWDWVLGNTNNKGDITNGGASLKVISIGGSPHNILFFSGDRTAINGDAAIGFWFFRTPVAPLPNGKFSGTHVNGDLLVLSHFTNGGGTSDIVLYEWNNGGLLFKGNYPNAKVNSSPQAVPLPFAYTSSSGVSGTYPSGAFFEGYIDLTAINASPCFTNFLVETRNSQSITASLQDFAAGTFTLLADPPVTVGDARCASDIRNLVLRANGCPGGTLNWYNHPTAGQLIRSGPGNANNTGTGNIYSVALNETTSFWVSCTTADGCVSPRVQVTGTVNPNPTVDGLVTIKSGITLFTDDIYNMNYVITPTAELTSSASPSGTYTYVWQNLNATNANYSFTPDINNPSQAQFRILSVTGLQAEYNFRVTATNGQGCSAVDEVKIIPAGAPPPCRISGPNPCPGAVATYVYDPSPAVADGNADALPANFTATWSIVADDPSKPNSNGAEEVAASSTNTYSVDTDVECNSEFTVRLTFLSTSGLVTFYCEKRVVVDDDVAPIFTNCPADVVQDCNVSILPAQTGLAAASDNCSAVVTYQDVVTPGCHIFITRTWTATDPCGNTATCIQHITVRDRTAPSIVCAANFGDAPTVSDLCNNVSTGTINVYYQDRNGIRTWTAVDNAGNTSTCTQSIPTSLREEQTTTSQATFVAPPVVIAEAKPKNAETKNVIVNEKFDDLKLEAYPNPFQNVINFKFTSPVSDKATIDMYNLLGQKIGEVKVDQVLAGVPQTIEYRVPTKDRVPMTFKLSIGNKNVRGKLLLPSRQ